MIYPLQTSFKGSKTHAIKNKKSINEPFGKWFFQQAICFPITLLFFCYKDKSIQTFCIKFGVVTWNNNEWSLNLDGQWIAKKKYKIQLTLQVGFCLLSSTKLIYTHILESHTFYFIYIYTEFELWNYLI